MPRVSIVVTNYNYQRFLPSLVEGELRQTMPDFELILLDDASTDNSREWLDKLWADSLAKKEHRIRYYPFPFRVGYPRLLNMGLMLAQSEYLSPLNADDYHQPGFLKAVTEALDKNPLCALAFTEAVQLNEAGAEIGQLKGADASYTRPGPEEFLRLLRGNYIHTCATVFRREAALRVGLFSEVHCPHHSDWLLWMRLALRWDVCYIAEPLACYRVHSGMLSKMYEGQGTATADGYRALELILAEAPDRLKPKVREAMADWVQRFRLST